MSEIRDDVEHSIDSALILYKNGEIDLDKARKQILGHPNIALVDREAELHVKPLYLRDALLKAGWVKKIND